MHIYVNKYRLLKK